MLPGVDKHIHMQCGVRARISNTTSIHRLIFVFQNEPICDFLCKCERMCGVARTMVRLQNGVRKASAPEDICAHIGRGVAINAQTHTRALVPNLEDRRGKLRVVVRVVISREIFRFLVFENLRT